MFHYTQKHSLLLSTTFSKTLQLRAWSIVHPAVTVWAKLLKSKTIWLRAMAQYRIVIFSFSVFKTGIRESQCKEVKSNKRVLFPEQ